MSVNPLNAAGSFCASTSPEDDDDDEEWYKSIIAA